MREDESDQSLSVLKFSANVAHQALMDVMHLTQRLHKRLRGLHLHRIDEAPVSLRKSVESNHLTCHLAATEATEAKHFTKIDALSCITLNLSLEYGFGSENAALRASEQFRNCSQHASSI
jgi:hypothetical protein